MSNVELGKITDEFSDTRDAIHVAVVSVMAAAILQPGQRVKLNANGDAVPAIRHAGIGVVDPFLPEQVIPGCSFWLLLNPGSARNLRHDWDHPAFRRAEPEHEPDDMNDDGCSC